MGKDCAGYDNENHCADDFADEVRRPVAYRAIGAKDAELGCGIGCGLPVRGVVQHHQRCAAHCTEQLSRPVVQHLRIITADDRRREGNCRIEVRAGAAKGLRHQNAAEYAQRPAGGDNHPARVGSIRLAQCYAGTYAGAKQHQDQCPHKLA